MVQITRQYYTREALLVELGPTSEKAPFVFNSAEDAKFPVVTVDERKPGHYLAVVGYKPQNWSKHYATLATLELTTDELSALPTEEFPL